MPTDPAGWDEVIRFDAPDPVPLSEHPYWKLMDPYYDEVKFQNPPDVIFAQLKKLPPAVATLFAANIVFAEVQNGAFPQLFANSTGFIAPEAAIAYRSIGLPDTAELLEKAMAHLGPVYPRERKLRTPIVDKIESDEKMLSGLLDLSTQYLDSLGKQQQRYVAAMDAYAVKYGKQGSA